MDISPLADKQQQSKNRSNSRQPRSEDRSRLDEYSTLSPASHLSREVLSAKRINSLIEQLNRMTGAMDISFELKQSSSLHADDTVVEVVDSRENEMLLELTMADLVEIEKQIKEDSVEDISELMCGSFFSLTA
jgi:hypothetical protein